MVAPGTTGEPDEVPVLGESFGARGFEDGTAVFDPVTWQTHIVSNEAMTLLCEMVVAASACGRDPEQVCARLLGEIVNDGADQAEVPLAGPHLRQWAALACHLAGDPAPVP